MDKKHVAMKMSQINATEMPEIYEYNRVMSSIKTFVDEKLKGEYGIYADHTAETHTIIFEDCMEDKNVIFLGNVNEYNEHKWVTKTHTQQAKVIPALDNAIIYYPSMDVAVAKYSLGRFDGFSINQVILSQKDENVERFLDYVAQREREHDNTNVTIFTDTERGILRSREPITNMVKRKDVFLDEDMKQQIYRSIDEFFSEEREFYKKYNLPYKRGVLFYGKPGNGKTTLVKSIASSVSAPVAYWQINEYTSSDSIKEVFEAATRMSPMVLVIEDIDSIPQHVRSTFLNVLDGATSKEGVFLIGTTNYPEKIDPALKNRAGRFNNTYKIPNPSKEVRCQYLKHKKMDFVSEREFEEIIIQTEGMSIAQLNEIFELSALDFHYEGKVNISKIIGGMKENLKRQAKGDYEIEDNVISMGFGQSVGFR